MDPRARQTVTEMLQQRGYTVTDEDDVVVGNRRFPTSDKVVVFYNPVSISISHIKEYVGVMGKTGFDHAIVIYKDGVTPQASKTIEMLTDKEIEVFQEKKMLYNITKHRLVPTHRCLSAFEIESFKRKYGIKIPVLLQTDVVVRFYNFKPGDVIEITRADGIVVYRIVK